jgi:hypothetical protein
VTDWSKLETVLGPATEVPVLLRKLETDPDPDSWSELWALLYHQGSTYSASLEALPRLVTICRLQPSQGVDALALAGHIVAASPGVQDSHPDDIAELRELANQYLVEPEDDYDCIYLMAAALAFGDFPEWGELLAGLAAGGFEVSCPGCENSLDVLIPASEGDQWEGSELEPVPADPAKLSGEAAWMYATAVAAQRPQVAIAVTELFGTVTCPECETSFVLGNRVVNEDDDFWEE